jgi:hypothetical protein
VPMLDEQFPFQLDHEPGSVWENVVPPIIGLVIIGALACGVWAMKRDVHVTAPWNCARITDDQLRLRCFDELAVHRPPAKGALAPQLQIP